MNKTETHHFNGIEALNLQWAHNDGLSSLEENEKPHAWRFDFSRSSDPPQCSNCYLEASLWLKRWRSKFIDFFLRAIQHLSLTCSARCAFFSDFFGFFPQGFFERVMFWRVMHSGSSSHFLKPPFPRLNFNEILSGSSYPPSRPRCPGGPGCSIHHQYQFRY